MADFGWICPECGTDCLTEDQTDPEASSGPGVVPSLVGRVTLHKATTDEPWQIDKLLSPSADLPACRDENPAQPAVLAACYPEPETSDD